MAWQIETLSSRHDRAKISLQITRILSGFPSSQVERAGKVGGIRGKRTRKPAAYVFDHVSTHGRRKKKKREANDDRARCSAETIVHTLLLQRMQGVSEIVIRSKRRRYLSWELGIENLQLHLYEFVEERIHNRVT